MPDKYERAFRRYVIDGSTVADVARELNTSTASVIRWARRWEKEHPTQAHEARRAAAERLAGKTAPEEPRGFMARLAAEQGGVPPVVAKLVGAAGPMAGTVPLEPESDDEDDEDDTGVGDDLPDDADALTIVKRAIRELRAHIETARRSSQLETVQRFTRSLVELVNAQRQLERSARREEGLIVASKADIDAGIKEIEEKVAAAESSTLVCAECGRKMRRKKAEDD